MTKPDGTNRCADQRVEADPFAGPGEMRALCRAVDWSATSIGEVRSWPPALRVAVRLCLDARIPMSVWAGPDLTLIYNEGYPPVLGPDKHPLALGRPAREVWPEFWDRLGPELDRVVCRGESLCREDVPFVLRRGAEAEEAFFTYSFTPVLDEGGQIVAALNVFVESTGQVRSRERERDLERIFELSHELLAVLGTDGRFRNVNPAFTRVLGWSREEMLDHDLHSLLHPEDRERSLRELERLAVGRPTLAFENRCRHRDGSYRVLSWSAAPVPDEGLVYAAARDVTERQRSEAELIETRERLLRQEKLAMVGSLAGAVAHELRNPLGAIKNVAYLLRLFEQAGEPARTEAVGVLESEVGRAERIVASLLEFAWPKPAEACHAGVAALVREAIERSAVPAEVTVVQEVEDGLEVIADPRQLVQVLGALVTNAVQAMQGRGRLEIRGRRSGGLAVLEVKDSGQGVVETDLARIFEPLFTTKARGLGLGLAIAKELVARNAGTIEVASALGEGTTFTLGLPAVEQPES